MADSIRLFAASEPQNRFARFRRWHPEWWFAIPIAVAWVLLLTGFPGTTHPHSTQIGWGESRLHHSLMTTHAGSDPAEPPLEMTTNAMHWAIMSVAMMLPLTLPVARYVGMNSFRSRRWRAMFIYLASYLVPWMIFGLVVIVGYQFIAGVPQVDDRLLLAGTLVAAAGWQISPWKRRAMHACRKTLPLRPLGWRGDIACLRLGVLQGWRCIRSCWLLMLLLVVIGHNAWLPVLALFLLMLVEERSRNRIVMLPYSALALLAPVVYMV